MKLVITALIIIVKLLIQSVEYIQYYGNDFDQNDINKKIVETLDLEGIEIKTDTGYKPLSNIHLTQIYDQWDIELENGMKLSGADNHILFKEGLEEVFIKDLKVGDFILTEDGLQKIVKNKKSIFKSTMLDVTVDDENHRFYSNGILSHNTTTVSIFFAWYLCFNVEKTAFLLSNKGATTNEIVDKTKQVMARLPFFIKPGAHNITQSSMNLDNGCKLLSQATSKNAAIGFTIHLLYLDEFAHIAPNIVKSFYDNVYPTLSSSDVSRIIITSTPNGINKFYEIYTEAEKGENEFFPYRVDWWDVPGRDDKWKKREIANLGSEEAFNEQYGNQFIIASKILLDAEDFKRMKKKEVEFVHVKDLDAFDDLEELYNIPYHNLKWHPDFEPDDLDEDAKYIVSVDLGEGIGGDYTVANIFQVVPLDPQEWKYLLEPSTIYEFFKMKQVGVFRSNRISIPDFSKFLYTLLVEFMDPEMVRLIFEYNIYGEDLYSKLQLFKGDNNEFVEEMTVGYYHTNSAKARKPGLKLKNDNKKIICRDFKGVYKQRRIEITEVETVSEARSFGRDDDGNFYAQLGHDDLFMSSINATTILNNLYWEELVEELFDYLDSSMQEKIERKIGTYAESKSESYDMYDSIDTENLF